MFLVGAHRNMLSIPVLSSAAYQWTPAVTRIGWVGARTHELRTPGPSANWLGGNGNLSPEAQQARARELALIEWLKENGVHLSSEAGWGRAAHPLRVESATVDDFEPSGRGLLARKGITQGEIIVQLNTKLVLTKPAAQRALGKCVVPDSMGEYLAIALLLMHECALADKSFWAPYIDILPTAEEVGQSFVWSDDEMELLEGSGVYAAARSMQQKLQREWKALEEGVLAAHPTTVEGASYENFVWAMSMLFSRAVNLKEDAMLALVPYADLLNHSPYSNCYFMCNKIPFSDEKEVTLYADRNYAAGDQVKNTPNPPTTAPPTASPLNLR